MWLDAGGLSNMCYTIFLIPCVGMYYLSFYSNILNTIVGVLEHTVFLHTRTYLGNYNVPISIKAILHHQHQYSFSVQWLTRSEWQAYPSERDTITDGFSSATVSCSALLTGSLRSNGNGNSIKNSLMNCCVHIIEVEAAYWNWDGRKATGGRRRQ